MYDVTYDGIFRHLNECTNLIIPYFVPLQIVAVILSTTGIALLAYMDGINDTRTLAGVVLAAASAAGSAIYKVMFKRIFGDVTFCQVAIFFTMIGLCSLVLLWPIFLALYFSGMGMKILSFQKLYLPFSYVNGFVNKKF